MKTIQLALLAILISMTSLSQAATFGNITANGDTDTVWCNGPIVFKANGTWGSGTFIVYYKSKTGAFNSLAATTALTSDATGQVLYDLPLNNSLSVKATLAGATSPSLAWEFICKDGQ